jgi:NDP-sugar pyrophosphorylase family protein
LEKTKIIILAGGKGTRLKPITESIPKPLIKLNGKSVLEYIMNLCSSQGYKEFVVCTGYKAEMIETAVEEFKKEDWKIDFSNAGENATMLERIRTAAGICGERFIVCYGDTVADVSLEKLIGMHEKNNALITNVLYQMQSPFGIVETDGEKVVSFKEKPLLPAWVNVGYFVFEKAALSITNDNDWVAFLEETVKTNRFFAEKHAGEHITFNTEKEKAEAEKKINVFSYIFE